MATSLLQMITPGFVPNAKTYYVDTKVCNAEEIERRIKTDVFKKQIRVKDFFQDFDRLRQGIVTQDKFRSAIAMLNIYLTENEIQALLDKYNCGMDQYNWTGFLRSIDVVFSDPDLTRKTLIQKPPPSETDMKHILYAYRNAIKTNRIMLKQPFQDFDKTNSSRISKTQFQRVLDNLKILPNAQAFEKLAEFYRYDESTTDVNYVRFCSDVDDLDSINNPGQDYEEKKEIFKDVIDDISNVNLLGTLFVSKRLPTSKEYQQAERKVQAEVAMKQIRIRQFFIDFDPLRKGTVSEHQFRRILHMSNVDICEDEKVAILNQFREPSGLINYFQFCDAIDQVFTQKELEKDPLMRVNQMDSTTTLPARRTFLYFNEQEKQEVDHLIQVYRKEIANKRVLIKPHFQDFDKTKQGYITKNQFLRILHQFGLFPDEKSLNLLLRKYIDKGNLDEVNYYTFCRDVDIQLEEDVKISSDHANLFKSYQKTKKDMFQTVLREVPNDFQDLLARLRKKIKEERIRVKEFLRDFDKLRSGTITESQLRLGLNMGKIALSNIEFQILLDHYACPDKQGYIKWQEFCDDIDQVFLVKKLEKFDPSQRIPEPNLKYDYGKVEISEREKILAKQVKLRFMEFCKSRRVDMKQFFQDWDKLGRNKVSPKQFEQVLTIANFDHTKEELTALVKMYYSYDDGDVRYVDFINDTIPSFTYTIMMGPKTLKSDAEELAKKEMASQYVMPKAVVKTMAEMNQNLREAGPHPSEQVILNKIKSISKVNQLRLEEQFRDFDPLRKGSIPKNKFRGIMSILKISLHENELQLLEEMYDCDNGLKFNFEKFLSDINCIFTKPALDKDPLAKPEEFKIPFFLDPKDILTDQEEKELHTLMTTIGEGVRKQRIIFKSHFQDKDITKSGKISFTRFRSILDNHKLPLDERQYYLLCKRFQHQGIEFNYVEFDQVLKQYEQFYQYQF